MYIFVYYLYDSALVFVACVICSCIIWYLDVFKEIVIKLFSLKKDNNQPINQSQNQCNDMQSQRKVNNAICCYSGLKLLLII